MLKITGVSTTIPTIEFSPLQVIFSDDAFSDSPQERRLNVKRSDDKIRGKKLSNSSNVMNDVCVNRHPFPHRSTFSNAGSRVVH